MREEMDELDDTSYDLESRSPLGSAIRDTLSSLQERFDCGSPAHAEANTEDAHVFFKAADCTRGGIYADDMSESTDDGGREQLRRLSSWGTYGTANSQTMAQKKYDDDGNPIDPVILERTIEQRRRRSKPRTVKFAYPPITSLKQCPRHDDPEIMADLFFTSSELDQYEEDRRQTTMVDDVEIVAVSTSTLSKDDELDDSNNTKFSRYVPSPTKHNKNGLSNSSTTKRMSKQKSSASTSSSTKESSKRLLKSVQIFLRERSTGM